MRNFFSSIVVIAMLIPAHVFADTFTCQLKPTMNYDGVTPREMVIEFDESYSGVIIRDDVAPKVGVPVHVGQIDRLIGDDILFVWKLHSIPNALKPPSSPMAYRNTVIFRGRLNQKRRSIRIIGNFARASANDSTGINMRAEGKCRKTG